MAKKPTRSEEDKALEQAVALLEQMAAWNSTHKLAVQYAKPWPHPGGPYPWQVEYHDKGSEFHQRAIIAGNRVGKTRTAAAEVAIHLTGQYPDWWRGYRFKTPVVGCVCNTTNEALRDVTQNELIGNIRGDGDTASRNIDGTGWIPLDCIGEHKFRQGGISNLLDTLEVKHVSGGWSKVYFKSYAQGQSAFQGAKWHFAWPDEEPEGQDAWAIISEIMTRLLDYDGILLATRTPLFGYSEMIQHFMASKPGVWYRNVTWDDSPHLTPEARERLRASFAEHEVDARTKGMPMLGSGAVYNVPQELYTCDPLEIPKHFRRIVGIDFGIDHPAAAAWIAHDPDTDIIYVYDCYKMAGKVPAYHAQAINSRGDWIPVAWPHDGATRDKGGGVALADQYRELGVNMLGFSARLDDDKGGGQPRAPTTEDILARMHTGRFKVSRHLTDLLEELRMLHRKNGVIVPVNDDAESAVRYAVMMLRCALSKSQATAARHGYSESYDPLGAYC